MYVIDIYRNVFGDDLEKPITERVKAVFNDHYVEDNIENVVSGVVECVKMLRKNVSFAYHTYMS